VTLATKQAVELDLFVEETEWLGRFDRLEVWRSRGLEAGPYEPLTSDAWLPARIPADATGAPTTEPGPSINLAGRTLELEIYESISLSISFVGPDPLTLADAAAQITGAALGLVRSFVVLTGSLIGLVIETEAPGLQAILRVVGGTAAPRLGLAIIGPDAVSFGRDGRIPLVSGRARYKFVDPNGAPEYFYKTRYFNASSRETSAFSARFRAPAIARLSSTSLVRGTVALADGSGNPIPNRTVLVYLRLQSTQVEERTIVGGPAIKTTDKNGRVEFMLVRGSSITVAVGGTDLARAVEVPTDPAIETFDLLSPTYGKDDLFAVQRLDIEYAARRSL
jgi:hypothetical protein